MGGGEGPGNEGLEDDVTCHTPQKCRGSVAWHLRSQKAVSDDRTRQQDLALQGPLACVACCCVVQKAPGDGNEKRTATSLKAQHRVVVDVYDGIEVARDDTGDMDLHRE
jgi:hypothetical protein